MSFTRLRFILLPSDFTFPSAIETTALNPGGVGPFRGSFSDPPTPAEMEAFAAYVETLRVAPVR